MTGLTLIGIADDGAHLVVESADGARHELAVTDELRRAVRQAMAASPPAYAHDAVPASASITPREIQQRLRAGLTAAELAEISGEPLAAIEKFAAPVMAERHYVIDQALATRIGREGGAPTLGDLVTDRLAARGVRPEDAEWDAWRAPEEPWRVAVDFRVEARSTRAVWTYDHTARSLTAEDDEARWLTETELLDAPIPRRHLAAVRPDAGPDRDATPRPVGVPVDKVHSDGAPPSASIPMPESALLSPTEALLEDLDGRRGTRETLDLDEDDDEAEDFEGFGPAHHARTAAVGLGVGGPDAEPATETTPSPSAQPATAATAPTDRGKGKRPRASVPSWDEIVFGARQQQE